MFPNAEIKVPAVDWAFWMSDENMAKAPNEMMKNYFANTRKVYAGLADKVTKYEWGKEVAPGITAIDTAGHTPGHTAFAVASGTARCWCSRTSPIFPRCSCAIPDWHVAFDIDPTRRPDPSQVLRHGGGREDADRRVPLRIPLARPRREGRDRAIGLVPDRLGFPVI